VVLTGENPKLGGGGTWDRGDMDRKSKRGLCGHERREMIKDENTPESGADLGGKRNLSFPKITLHYEENRGGKKHRKKNKTRGVRK